MPCDPNDPRLTTYALGELDEAERSSFEAELADWPDSQHEIEEIRATAQLLTEQLRNEPTLGLANAQREAIEGRLRQPRFAYPKARWIAYAAAASLLIATGVLALRAPERRAPEQVAMLERRAKSADVAPAGRMDDLALRDQANEARRLAPAVSDAKSGTAVAPEQPATENMYLAPAAPASTSAPAEAAPAVPKNTFMYADGSVRFNRETMPPPAGAAPAPANGPAPARIDQGIEGQNAAKAPAVAPEGAMLGFAGDANVARRGVTSGGAQMGGMGGGMAGIAGGVAAGGGRGLPAQTRGGEAAGAGAAPLGGMMARNSLATESKFKTGADAAGRSVSQSAPHYARAESLSRKLASAPAQPTDGTKLGRAGKPAAGTPLTPGLAVPGGAKDGRQKEVAQVTDGTSNMALFRQRAKEKQEKELSKAPAAPGAKPLQLAERDREAREFQLGDRTRGLTREQVEQELRVPERLADEAKPALDAMPPQLNGEVFHEIVENDFKRVKDEPLSTFSIDVDTASYANVRRYLQQHNVWPPKDAVRVEEMVNYFRYNDPEPAGEQPFSVNVEVARCPWNADHRLARIGLRGRAMADANRPPSNLVFLIDVSGSMQAENKLPLLKSAMQMLVEALGEKDRVAIVVYASTEGLVLPSTSAYRKGELLSALEQLQAGGSTNGGAGIKLAYDVASDPRNFIKEGVNRVILCTDGDFNVGIVNDGDLNRLIEEKRKSNVFLSVLGFGEANTQDAKMKGLAKNGNGNYHYIDSLAEGRKVLVEEGGGTLVTIAKDVKIQVEFNPAKVGAFRQIGYELRQMAHADFQNDAKDAGEIGAGHSVTALYELVPAGAEDKLQIAKGDDLVFQKRVLADAELSKKSFVVRVKYKRPTADRSEAELRREVEDTGRDYASASDDFKFSAAVASFGLIVRDSKYKGSATLASVDELAKASLGANPNSYRSEFLTLIRKAQEIGKR
jgi:Ca-activated chloride channel family protein